MKKLFCLILLSVLSSKLLAGPIIQVQGNLYEMGTVSGLLSTHRTTIESQVWFGKSSLARTFANTLGTQLNAPFNFNLGPAFGYEIYDGVLADYTKSWFYKPSNFHLEENNRAQLQNAGAGVYYTYAIATHVGVSKVSEPGSFILFSMLVLVLLSRKVA